MERRLCEENKEKSIKQGESQSIIIRDINIRNETNMGFIKRVLPKKEINSQFMHHLFIHSDII